jgi:hypothetical protein
MSFDRRWNWFRDCTNAISTNNTATAISMQHCKLHTHPDHELAHRVDFERGNVVHLDGVRRAAALHIACNFGETVADLVLAHVLQVF